MAQVAINNTAAVAFEDWDQVGSGLVSLESSATIYPGMACYILKSSGVWGVKLSGGSSYTALTDAIAVVDGFAFAKVAPGEPITLCDDVTFGNLITTEPTNTVTLFLSASTRGGYADAAAVTGAKPVGRAIGKTNSEKNLAKMRSIAY